MHLNSGCGEVRYFESDVDGRFSLGILSFDGRQSKVRPHQKLLAPGKRLDRPDDGVLTGNTVFQIRIIDAKPDSVVGRLIRW